MAAAAFFFNATTVGGALLVLPFCLVVALLHANAVEPGKLRAHVASGFLAASAVIAALSVLPVYSAHALSFTLAGWLTWGLYAAGLVLGVLQRLDMGQRVLALLLAVLMPAALVLMPVPNDTIAPDDQSRRWSVDLTVVDENGDPVAGAHAACGVVLSWDARRAQRQHWAADVAAATDAAGAASFHFDEDPRMKVVICTATRGAGDAEEEERPALVVRPAPVVGARLAVRVELGER